VSILNAQHIEVKDLTPAIRRALEAVRYGVRDIPVIAAERVSVNSSAPSKGSRGFTMVVNLETGKFEITHGSWGGSNIFVKTHVDDSDETVAIPENGVVIKGSTGYPRTFAYLYAHPKAIAKFLPSGDEETLTEVELKAIYCFAAIKGGQYRRDELRRQKVSDDTIESLIERGYLKRNRAGATQITTKGKNARSQGRFQY
jgi:hypothetical protein